jgi:hypothetical protein
VASILSANTAKTAAEAWAEAGAAAAPILAGPWNGPWLAAERGSARPCSCCAHGALALEPSVCTRAAEANTLRARPSSKYLRTTSSMLLTLALRHYSAVCAYLLLLLTPLQYLLAQGQQCTSPAPCVDPNNSAVDLTPLCTAGGTHVTWGGGVPPGGGTFLGDLVLNPCDGLTTANALCTVNSVHPAACLNSNASPTEPVWKPVGDPPATWLRPGEFFDPRGLTGIKLTGPSCMATGGPPYWSVTITFRCNNGSGPDAVEMYTGPLPAGHIPPPNSPPHAPGFLWAAGALNLTWTTIHVCAAAPDPDPSPPPPPPPPPPPSAPEPEPIPMPEPAAPLVTTHHHVVGLAIGGVVCVLLMLGALCFYLFRRNKKPSPLERSLGAAIQSGS